MPIIADMEARLAMTTKILQDRLVYLEMHPEDVREITEGWDGLTYPTYGMIKERE
jgi:hypothetical protein